MTTSGFVVFIMSNELSQLLPERRRSSEITRSSAFLIGKQRWHMFRQKESTVVWGLCNDSEFVLFALREDEDASHCAVPISTGLIKQIMNKTGNEDKPEQILADFYSPKTTSETPWPYVSRDADRYALLLFLKFWTVFSLKHCSKNETGILVMLMWSSV